MRLSRAWLIALPILIACTPGPTTPASQPHADPYTFLEGRLRPWPAGAKGSEIAVTDIKTGRVAIYDSALVALVALRHGKRARAASILSAMAQMQRDDGSLPFSFALPAPEPNRLYVRSGALAWVGYAAVEYLDSERGGPAREAIAKLAHRAAKYLTDHQVAAPGDPRDGLVRGGAGTIRYDIVRGVPREVFIPGEIPWVSIEHNVDTYFFLRGLARLTQNTQYEEAAKRIGQALVDRGWNAVRGQLVQGIAESETDRALALDCASWGSLLYQAVGQRERAETAASIADGRYASRDPRSSARGHLPYASGPILDDATLMRHYAKTIPAPTWDRVEAVWPEGSAGVALAALRTGRRERARAIVDSLEPLRAADGSLPTFTLEVPFTFDTDPSIAGTAWVELVKFELGEGRNATFWVP